MGHCERQYEPGIFPNKHNRVSDGTRRMMEKIKSWLEDRFSAREPTPPQDSRKADYHQPPRPAAPKIKATRPNTEYPEGDRGPGNSIESLGPGKNVLIRNRFVREDTGTHETLKILDDSSLDSGEEHGIDPYNTGDFDRSKKWDQRFRK